MCVVRENCVTIERDKITNGDGKKTREGGEKIKKNIKERACARGFYRVAHPKDLPSGIALRHSYPFVFSPRFFG